MAREKQLTPEKQLLKLIEDSKVNTAGVQVQAIKRHHLSLISFGAWSGRLLFLREELKKWLQQKGNIQPDIKLINSLLNIIIILLFVYLLFSFLGGFSAFGKISKLEFKASEDTGLGRAQDALSFKKPQTYYLEKIRERDILRIGQGKAIASESKGPKAPSSRIIDATQHLKLVGISWSADPVAMVEDSKALRTVFLKRGELIGDVKIQAIFKDKVILGYNGEEIELR